MTARASAHARDPADDAGPLLDPTLVRQATRRLRSAAPGASTVAIGLHRRGRRALVVQGHTAHHDGVPADTATRFEIGSLTKTFTAVLLAEQAARGELDHHDPLARHLPAGASLPPKGSGITLTHLATHTSGLPHTPPGLPYLLPCVLRRPLPRLLAAPYAGFTTRDALHALARSRLRATPGTRMRYSNFGVGLLGHALTHAAGDTSYATLLHTRVLRPLGLRTTDAATSPPSAFTQVTGYWRHRPLPPFRFPGLAAAGALRAGVRDLLALAEALLDPASAGVPPTLRTALHDVRRPRIRMRRGNGVALVWHIRTRPDGTRLYYHAGATFGCTSFAGFSPHHGTALVALANTSSAHGNTLVQEAYDVLIGLLGG
ncbi:serine hydrolase [Streptomyces sp. JJ36]|uniref:serine hydrolase domain-containing protein n=1 Tax=Streptomyces sp. JJ36 TaxID=2736645 RepID=UPI001F1E1E96|nr:serine hydrolase domain-containing protein [Streptomyces sp. JJ36]MCF6523969.1 beta-lactamase family protein [Streptomyces sp. JJ36]